MRKALTRWLVGLAVAVVAAVPALAAEGGQVHRLAALRDAAGDAPGGQPATGGDGGDSSGDADAGADEE